MGSFFTLQIFPPTESLLINLTENIGLDSCLFLMQWTKASKLFELDHDLHHETDVTYWLAWLAWSRIFIETAIEFLLIDWQYKKEFIAS